MQPARLDFYRRLLEERLRVLLADSPVESGSAGKPVATVSRRHHRLVHGIHEAMRRIDEGTYGGCVACGEPIDERRLMARPVATHCIDCKTEAEQLEPRRRAF